MKAIELADKLSQELGIYLTLSRLSKYEERGIIPLPKNVGKYKEYAPQDVERIKQVVILAELNVPLSIVRKYMLNIGKQEASHAIRQRIEEVSKLVSMAKGIWCNGAEPSR